MLSRGHVVHFVVLSAVLLIAKSATAQTFVTDAGQNAEANDTIKFTLSTNTITILVTNNYANPTDENGIINTVQFSVTGATGSGALATTNSGQISTINSDGTHNAALIADPLTRWIPTETGTSINLTAISGGKPNHSIIGPDSADGFVHAGTYIGNASLTNRNPQDMGTATFIITVPGVTASSTISSVLLYYGSTQTTSNTASKVAVTPEPGALAFAGAGLLSLFAFKRSRRRSLKTAGG